MFTKREIDMSIIVKRYLPIIFCYMYIFLANAIAVETLDFGTAGVRALSIEKEKELGSYFMTIARSQLGIIYDPVLQEYVTNLASRLVSQAENVKFPFEVILVDDNTINAAAFFGGKLMLHSGLFIATDAESELASVMAHEITHVTQRHLARSLEEQMDASTIGMVGILGSLILSIINPAIGMAGITASLGGVQQSAINYTRSNEFEADRIGIDLLYNSGFNPNAMASMMRKLQSRGESINPAFEMLLTHPLSEKRVAEAENRARLFETKQYYESIDYKFAKSRIEARYSNLDNSYNISAANLRLQKNKNDYGALYLLCLASLKQGNLQVAEESLNKIPQKYSRNLFVIDAYTDLYIAEKKYDKAIELLENLNKVMPNNDVIIINLANVYYEKGKYAKAERLLKHISRNHISVVADELLMNVFRKQKNTCEMYQLNTNIFEYKGLWDQALNNANQATKICSEKNTILKLRAQMSRIVESREFYKQLVSNF